MINKIIKFCFLYIFMLNYSCIKFSETPKSIEPILSPTLSVNPTVLSTINPTPLPISSNIPLIKKNNFSILALGDSYTIGESVNLDDRWTKQLIKKLKSDNLNFNEKTIATTGWTTRNLLDAIEEEKLQNNYDFVYLLIGVNNQYQGLNKEKYRSEFKTLLENSINLAQNKNDNVFVISIPDWGVTPFAKYQDKEMIAAEIDAFNLVNKEESEKLKVNYIDITPISRKAINDTSYIAYDGLHPSGKMYEEWAELLYKKTLEKINR